MNDFNRCRLIPPTHPSFLFNPPSTLSMSSCHIVRESVLFHACVLLQEVGGGQAGEPQRGIEEGEGDRIESGRGGIDRRI